MNVTKDGFKDRQLHMELPERKPERNYPEDTGREI